MIIDVVIPTYNRKESLMRTIKSVINARSNIVNHFIRINVFVSTQEELKDLENLNSIENCKVHLLEKEYRAPIFWNDYLKNMEADILCYLNDDVELHSDCFFEGIKAMTSLDKVVGFNQVNSQDPSKCSSAFGLIGSAFADRFPNRQVFCPDYYALYLDEEMGIYAKDVGCFEYCEKAKLNHYHPSWTKEKPDETHKHNRRNKNHDINIYRKRKQRNLIWGHSFERLI